MTRFVQRLAGLLVAAVLAAPLGAETAPDDEVEGGTLGTGIMGVITGLGSIHVGGVRVIVPADLQAVSVLGARDAGALRIGDTVVVEASPRPAGLTATAIRDFYPLIAPVQSVSGQRMQVLGLDLDLSDVSLPDPKAHAFAPGDWVAVSGLWRGDTVAVSALRRIAPRDAVTISGTFTAPAPDDQRVGPFRLSRPSVAHAAPGDHLRVTGQLLPDGRTLEPSEIDAGQFSPALQTLLIEGYMSQPDPKGIYTIYGSGIALFAQDPTMRVPENRSVFCITRSGPVAARQMLALDMPEAARRARLEALLTNPETHRCKAP